MLRGHDAGQMAGTPGRKLGALRRLREDQALTQEQLAQKAHLTRVTVWMLESGRRGATPPTIRKLARALRVKPVDLFGETHGV